MTVKNEPLHNYHLCRDLRSQGYDDRAIASRLGLDSPSLVQGYIDWGLLNAPKHTPTTIQELQATDVWLVRLNEVYTSIPEPSLKDVTTAISAFQKLSSRRAALAGLDAPTSITLNDPSTHATDVDRAIEELAEKLHLND